MRRRLFNFVSAAFFLLVFVIGLASCHKGSEGQMKETADSFAVAYFNWQFQKALPYVSPGSAPWLHYAASQVTQEDVDSLRAMSEGAGCHIESLDYADADTLATVTVRVSHFLSMDTIGRPSHVVDEAVYRLPMIYSNDQWRVHLTALAIGFHCGDRAIAAVGQPRCR